MGSTSRDQVPTQIRTSRLTLRRWQPTDADAFAEMNADPRVCEHLPATLTRYESDDLLDRIELQFSEHGLGLWLVERATDCEFLGFTGLSIPRFTAPFMPAVEIGWRLASRHWGQGFATEAARAALADGFERLELREIVSFTTPANERSRSVMRRIGMQHDSSDDFMHPHLPEGHPLRPHVLYRIRSGIGAATPAPA